MLTRRPGEQAPSLVTRDRTCTVPSFFKQGAIVPGTDARFVDLRTLALTGPVSFGRLTTGSVEIFELGELRDGAIDLVENQNCAALNRAWVPGDEPGFWVRSLRAGMAAPGGGLSGRASIVDRATGETYGYRALALDDFSDVHLNRPPSEPAPTLADVQSFAPDGQTVSTIRTDAGTVVLRWDRPIDAVSAVFARADVSLDVVVDAARDGATDLVFAFPTRRFYVSPTYGGPLVPAAPFVTAIDEASSDPASFLPVGFSAVDGDGRPVARCELLDLPYAVQSVPLGPTPILGAPERFTLGRPEAFAGVAALAGRARIIGGCDDAYRSAPAATGDGFVQLGGLPVIALALRRVTDDLLVELGASAFGTELLPAVTTTTLLEP